MHKYRAVPTVVDGIRFASKAEAARYAELSLLARAGAIRELECQPKYPLYSPTRGSASERVLVGHYIADFRYRSGPTGVLVIEDVKGVRTAMYQWKRKHFEAQYGLTITEIGRQRKSRRRKKAA